MGTIIDKITEFIKEMLQGWVLDNLETMLTDVNTKVGSIAGEVGQTPSSWNAGIFSMIRNLSDNVMIPIAGMIISAILCYELITMVMDKNNMHEMGSEFFFRYLIKACVAVMLLSKTFDITMAIFDVGNHIVTSASGVITGSTSLDVSSTLQTMFNDQLSTMGIGELIGLGIETMIVSLCMKIMSVLITVVLYGRMIEIYLYISVAPVPFATLSNREWGSIGNNYIKGLCALAFQGFFIMVCVGIYSVLVSSVAVASNLHTALWSVAAYTVILCFSLFKTGSLVTHGTVIGTTGNTGSSTGSHLHIECLYNGEYYNPLFYFEAGEGTLYGEAPGSGSGGGNAIPPDSYDDATVQALMEEAAKYLGYC